jgi:ABC-type transport system involved in multi-copper enzyme maturation permease subunit
MYLLENPVLQRELLVNLRMKRAFVLMLLYLAALGGVVYLAWPRNPTIDLTNPEASKRLVNMFFLGQFMLASLMAPSFAAGAITGEKERKSYEMLLASPMRPSAILLGKLLASLSHLAIFVFASLPIVVLCLPLGGVSIYEVGATYLALLLATATFGMLSLACSSYFQRTSASLVVSYLLVLPLAMLAAAIWYGMSDSGARFRLFASVTIVPGVAIAVIAMLFGATSRRLMHPPDVGSEGKEVVDTEMEMQQAVGLVIQRGQFPDNLFAPAKRDDLLADGVNPVFDKEMRSEIFAQGTLMLRVVIQMSMLLAIPLMFICFYWTRPQYAAWYVNYVLLFNVLVGPVFSAGAVTSERERETLELLLTTILSPWQILWAKLVAGLRVSSVLTLFLVWPLLLACCFVTKYWGNVFSMLLYVLIIILTCITTAVLALFASVFFRKTSVSLMTSYLLILILFMAPPAAAFFAETFLAPPGSVGAPAQDQSGALATDRMAQGATPAAAGQSAVQFDRRSPDTPLARLGFLSPFSASLAVPLTIDNAMYGGKWPAHYYFLAFYTLVDLALLAVMTWLFNVRWRVAQ